MPRNDQITRQWHLFRHLEGSRGATLRELVNAIPEDFPKNPRTLRRDLEALEVAGFPLLTEHVNGQTRWRLVEGFRNIPALGFSPTELMPEERRRILTALRKAAQGDGKGKSSGSDAVREGRGAIVARRGAEVNLPGDEIVAKENPQPRTLNVEPLTVEPGTWNFELPKGRDLICHSSMLRVACSDSGRPMADNFQAAFNPSASRRDTRGLPIISPAAHVSGREARGSGDGGQRKKSIMHDAK